MTARPMEGVRVARGGAVHLHAVGRRGAGRLGRRRHQGRARRARRRPAGPARAWAPFGRRIASSRSWSTPTAASAASAWRWSTPSAREVLYELVRRATCSSPTSCPTPARGCSIDVEDIRAVNPKHHLRAGQRARRPGARGGAGRLRRHRLLVPCRQPGGRHARRTPTARCGMPGPAYGDSIGAMTIAGGIAAALFARERTGEPSVVDVSLLGVGAWAKALPVDIVAADRRGWPGGPHGQAGPAHSTRWSGTTGPPTGASSR